jgi:hypothetical protein
VLLTFKLTQEEKKTLEREVARAKVSANRVATVVANEWKDGNDKVMPVKQWLEERRFFQVAYYINLLFLFFVMDLCANLVS